MSMEASDVTPQHSDAASAAALAIVGTMASLQVTTAGQPGAELADTHFPRLSTERRLLGHITDEVDITAFGPRNTLSALTYALMTDRNTTNPPESLPRLNVDGVTVVAVAQTVLDMLGALVEAGLVEDRGDGSYAVTGAGADELAH